ncbi:putative membrane protein [Sinorhizobium fredii]
MNERFIGYHKARVETRPDRFFLACAILALSIALLMSAALTTTTVLRKEWQYASAARV